MRSTGVWLLLAAIAGACGPRGSAPADGRTPVWLDISPAYGDPPRDPGDALALLQAYGSNRLAVRGVSITFGNVPLVRGYPVAKELMDRLDTGLLRPWRGASTAEERAAPTEATELLAEALGKERLTILSLGPVTTLASLLLREPNAASRIERVVVVGGRHLDAGANGSPTPETNAGADPGSLQVLLDTAIPLTVVPADRSTGFVLQERDLDALGTPRGALALVLPAARTWAQMIAAREGGAGFAAPALLAVDVAAHPGEVRCEAAMATVDEPSGQFVVSSTPGAAGRPVTWCHTADAGARERILRDVAASMR